MDPKLVQAIAERLKKIGQYGRLTLVVDHGRVSGIDSLSTERWQAGEAA